jgi:hypothetical protein
MLKTLTEKKRNKCMADGGSTRASGAPLASATCYKLGHVDSTTGYRVTKWGKSRRWVKSKSTPSTKSCPVGKMINPSTGNCVLIRGKIGRRLTSGSTNPEKTIECPDENREPSLISNRCVFKCKKTQYRDPVRGICRNSTNTSLQTPSTNTDPYYTRYKAPSSSRAKKNVSESRSRPPPSQAKKNVICTGDVCRIVTDGESRSRPFLNGIYWRNLLSEANAIDGQHPQNSWVDNVPDDAYLSRADVIPLYNQRHATDESDDDHSIYVIQPQLYEEVTELKADDQMFDEQTSDDGIGFFYSYDQITRVVVSGSGADYWYKPTPSLEKHLRSYIRGDQ